MHHAPEFMETAPVLRACRAALLAGQDLRQPVVRLRDQPHWQPSGGVDAEIESAQTLLLLGSFYNFSTPSPDTDAIQRAAAAARKQAVEQILVPHVRWPIETTALPDAGFLPVQRATEVFIWAPEGLVEVVRKVAGNKAHRENLRLARRADERYAFEWRRATELEDVELARIAELHDQHAERYGSPLNPFCLPALEALVRSEVGPSLIAVLRRSRLGGTIDQAYLLYDDAAASGSLFISTQASARQPRQQGVNLYRGSLIRILERAQELGIRCVHLGRGGADEKRRFGANRRVPLLHWVLPLSPRRRDMWQRHALPPADRQ